MACPTKATPLVSHVARIHGGYSPAVASSQTPVKKRKRVQNAKTACDFCRRRHLGCENERPCKCCVHRGIECTTGGVLSVPLLTLGDLATASVEMSNSLSPVRKREPTLNGAAPLASVSVPSILQRTRNDLTLPTPPPKVPVTETVSLLNNFAFCFEELPLKPRTPATYINHPIPTLDELVASLNSPFPPPLPLSCFRDAVPCPPAFTLSGKRKPSPECTSDSEGALLSAKLTPQRDPFR